jgi:MFS family permease
LFGLQMGAVTAPTLLVPTLLQDITPASLRSRAIAAGSLVMIALTSMSPLLVGVLSDALAETTQGLRTAVVIVGVVSLAMAAVLLQSAQGAIVSTVKSLNAGMQTP